MKGEQAVKPVWACAHLLWRLWVVTLMCYLLLHVRCSFGVDFLLIVANFALLQCPACLGGQYCSTRPGAAGSRRLSAIGAG